MKKPIAILLVLILSLSITACGSAAEPPAAADTGDVEPRLLEPGKLIVATEATYPPYEMYAEEGDDVAETGMTGIDLELAAAIAEKLGLELVVNDIDFDAALLSVQNGKADLVLAGVDVTEARERTMCFSEPYAEVVQVVVVRKDSGIRQIEELKDKKVGAVRGTTGANFFMDDLDPKDVTLFDDYASAVQSLSDGKVKALLLDKAPADSIVKGHDTLEILEHTYSEEDYAIGMALDNPGLQKAVDQALAELRADGTLQQIIERYIPSDPV